MALRQTHWYRLIIIICAFLLLLMVYRREARIHAYIETMEARIEALERYTQALAKSEVQIEDSTAALQALADMQTYREKSRREKIGRKRTSYKEYREAKLKNKETDTLPSAKERASLSDALEEEDEPTDYEEIYPSKFTDVVRLELNSVDSATLIRVPGIGEGTARAILQYRKRLGGYYSAEQLREKLTWESALPYLDSWCDEWFWADENLMQKLHVNELSFSELLRHPYLEYKDVKAIMNWRDRRGPIRKAKDLYRLGIKDSTQLEKLLHYVEF